MSVYLPQLNNNYFFIYFLIKSLSDFGIGLIYHKLNLHNLKVYIILKKKNTKNIYTFNTGTILIQTSIKLSEIHLNIIY